MPLVIRSKRSSRLGRRSLALLAWALLLLTLALPALAAPGRPPAGAIPATLVDVIDGRTIEVSIEGRSSQILYAGIMTPQNAAPGFWSATAANSVLLRSGPVYLVEDPALDGRTFGEALPRYVYLADGTFVNAELWR